MLAPSIFGENLFDDWFDFPSFGGLGRVENKLYGGRSGRLMKTEGREKEGQYDMDIDLPGFKKEDIKVELHDGYLQVSAVKGLNEEEKDEKGKLIRQERYSGSMQRSFYVGDSIKQEDVKAKFEQGVLKLSFPKEGEKKLPEKQPIMIEG